MNCLCAGFVPVAWAVDCSWCALALQVSFGQLLDKSLLTSLICSHICK